jgi:hypothetical protein
MILFLHEYELHKYIRHQCVQQQKQFTRVRCRGGGKCCVDQRLHQTHERLATLFSVPRWPRVSANAASVAMQLHACVRTCHCMQCCTRCFLVRIQTTPIEFITYGGCVLGLERTYRNIAFLECFVSTSLGGAHSVGAGHHLSCMHQTRWLTGRRTAQCSTTTTNNGA